MKVNVLRQAGFMGCTHLVLYQVIKRIRRYKHAVRPFRTPK
jgi:hypothetical protein